MTTTPPRSITEAKRAEAAASFSAACAKAAYRTNETPENYRAHMDASVAYMGASRACYLLKRRKHGARGLVAWCGRDAVSVRSGREHRGRIATEARKAERAARREAERAARVEREAQARAAFSEVSRLLLAAKAEQETRGKPDTLILDRETVRAIDDASAEVRS